MSEITNDISMPANPRGFTFSWKSYVSYSSRAFTLVEVLIVVVILLVLAFLALLIIDPIEISRKGRDSIRMNDLQLVFKAVQLAIDEQGEPSAGLLCFESPTPCSGNSLDIGSDVRKTDGTGWVKVDIDHVKGVNLAVLPVDPLKNGPNRYEYFSNGLYYEINGQFESKEYVSRMRDDGGNSDQRFELGTRLDLIN